MQCWCVHLRTSTIFNGIKIPYHSTTKRPPLKFTIFHAPIKARKYSTFFCIATFTYFYSIHLDLFAGNYTLHVQNDAGANAFTYQVVVYSPPMFKFTSQNQTKRVSALEGTSIRLDCDVDGLPTPNVNNKFVPISEYHLMLLTGCEWIKRKYSLSIYSIHSLAQLFVLKTLFIETDRKSLNYVCCYICTV